MLVRPSTSGVCSHRVDVGDTIVELNEAWKKFARENGAPRLANEALGTYLWIHIRGEAVREIYLMLLRRVRSGAGPIEFPFRCDSPDRKRFMRMRIEGVADGGVRFSSWLLAEEARTQASEGNEAIPVDFITVCSWCLRFKQDGWLPIDTFLAGHPAMCLNSDSRITHGICPECRKSVFESDGTRRNI